MIEETTEIWKTIPELPNYQVSNKGNVKSIERKVYNGRGYYTLREKILKPCKNRGGYMCVNILKEGKLKNIRIHRLVADAFLPNPLNLPQINHRNEDKSDNRLENLEYCDAKYNVNYGTRTERASKKVKCINTGKIYPSTMEVKRKLGFPPSHISECCNKKRKTCGGFNWEWAE